MLEAAGIPGEARQEIVEKVMEFGHVPEGREPPGYHPQCIRRVADITAEEHVRMQAAMQAFVDNQLSKTINFPAGATPEGCCPGIPAGLGTGMQGHHRVCDRFAREGGAGNQGHRREEESEVPMLPSTRSGKKQETPPTLAARLHLYMEHRWGKPL